jgi:hypothetical protein
VRLAKLGFRGLILVCVLSLAAADDSTALPASPAAKKESKVTEINGHKLVDNYY